MPKRPRVLILGGGVTGLAAGCASGRPVFEACEAPGAICSSYYMRAGESRRLNRAPRDGEAYRFEIGGGHWIFGGGPSVLRYLRRLVPMKRYARRASVYIRRTGQLVPYPLQNHLRCLDRGTARAALREIQKAQDAPGGTTMSRWLEANFGSTLYELFFKPFHKLYTSGLFASVAPQDAHKSPLRLSDVRKGAVRQSAAVGYNVNYLYPRGGLDGLCRALASRCDIRYGKTVRKIDPKRREVHFGDGSTQGYDQLLSTLPLNRMMELSGLRAAEKSDPYTSVLVLNIGAERGRVCPDDHWIYVSDSRAGFHRVGFYSNVDASFLPQSARRNRSRAALYVERAYPNGRKPSPKEIETYAIETVREFQERGYIGKTEVVDPTWIDVAYTWRHPGSHWKESAVASLESRFIRPIGRYGLWKFQGIADSVSDGLLAGKESR